MTPVAPEAVARLAAAAWLREHAADPGANDNALRLFVALCVGSADTTGESPSVLVAADLPAATSITHQTRLRS